jgi:medium-chain acyl-[acyl-carrier-protein] hydrolase
MKFQSTSTPWLILAKPNPAADLRLFCLPYAGGSPMIFCDWPAYLPPNVEVCPIQLPGRAMRLSHPPFTRVDALIEALVPALQPFLNKPFAFFGHSMGGLLSFELARALRLKFSLEPEAVFIAGRQAPPLHERTSIIYDLPEPRFLEELRHLNGTPPEVLEQPELMRLLVPLLRADFELCQTYVYQPGPVLDCPLYVFGGLDDREVNYEELDQWRGYTTGPFSLRMLPGDHFFIRRSQAQLLQMISKDLKTHRIVSAGDVGYV